MKTYPKPVRRASTEAQGEILESLIQRYRIDQVGAKGILVSIAELAASDNMSSSFPDAIDFFLLVAREIDPWEPVPDLRETARQILYRRCMRDLLTGTEVSPGEALHVKNMLMFLYDTENCPKLASDRGTVLKFLERAWAWQRRTEAPRWLHLVEASIAMGYLDPLEAQWSDIKQLYWHIYKALPEKMRQPPLSEDPHENDDSIVVLAGTARGCYLRDTHGAQIAKLLELFVEWLAYQR